MSVFLTAASGDLIEVDDDMAWLERHPIFFHASGAYIVVGRVNVYVSALAHGPARVAHVVLHVDENRKNCTRKNLIDGPALRRRANKVGFRGVSFLPRRISRQYRAYIPTKSGKQKVLGLFETADAAARAYDAAAMAIHGNRAILNFPATP